MSVEEGVAAAAGNSVGAALVVYARRFFIFDLAVKQISTAVHRIYTWYVASSSGSSEVIGVSSSTAGSVFTVFGSSTAAGQAVSTFSAKFDSAGLAIATAEGVQQAASYATASGTSLASAVSSAVASSVFNVLGESSASGAGNSDSPLCYVGGASTPSSSTSFVLSIPSCAAAGDRIYLLTATQSVDGNLFGVSGYSSNAFGAGNAATGLYATLSFDLTAGHVASGISITKTGSAANGAVSFVIVPQTRLYSPLASVDTSGFTLDPSSLNTSAFASNKIWLVSLVGTSNNRSVTSAPLAYYGESVSSGSGSSGQTAAACYELVDYAASQNVSAWTMSGTDSVFCGTLAIRSNE